MREGRRLSLRFFRDFCFRCDLIFLIAAGFASADATRGHENRRSLRAPPRPLRVHTPILLGYRCRTELIRLQLRAYFKLEKHSRKSAKNPPKIAENPPFSLDKGCFLYYSCIQSANKMHFASADVLTRKDTNAAEISSTRKELFSMAAIPFQPMMESRPIREIAYEVLKHAIITGEIPAG